MIYLSNIGPLVLWVINYKLSQYDVVNHFQHLGSWYSCGISDIDTFRWSDFFLGTSLLFGSILNLGRYQYYNYNKARTLLIFWGAKASSNNSKPGGRLSGNILLVGWPSSPVFFDADIAIIRSFWCMLQFYDVLFH